MNEPMQTETDSVLLSQTSQPTIGINTARVFMLERVNNVDTTAALEYGQLCALFKSFKKENGKYYNIWETEDFQDKIIKKLEELKYNPKIDYILVAGHMTSMVVFATTIINSFDAEYAKFLLWNSKKQKYVVKEL